MSYETRTLEKLQLAVKSKITRHALVGLKDVELLHMYDHLTDSMLLQLRAHVYEDPSERRKDTYRIEEREFHPTWKHQLVHQQPKDTFRRRFLCYFWDIPLDYAPTKRTHVVEVTGRAVFPDMQREFPPEFGAVQYVAQIDPRMEYA